MLHRICWPWCDCRKQRRGLERAIHAIDWVEAAGGWLPQSEHQLRAELQARLDRLS